MRSATLRLCCSLCLPPLQPQSVPPHLSNLVMASVYTTSRGKNKKQKLGNRKDASNNAANKLSTTITKSLLETVMEGQSDKKTLTLGSSEQRRKTALLKAQEKLQLTAGSTAAAAAAASTTAGGEESVVKSEGDAPASAATVAAALASLSISASSPPLPLPDTRLDLCHFAACPHKRNVDADEDKEKAAESESSSLASSSARLLLCGGCRRVSYCSGSCQKSDWSMHKVECKQWKAAQQAAAGATSADSSSSSTATAASKAAGL